MERASPTLQWPPAHQSDYHRLALGSRVVQAELLTKAGEMDAFTLGDFALLRSAQAEIRLGPTWDDRSFFHYRILQRRTGVNLGATVAPTKGRCIMGVDWTHPLLAVQLVDDAEDDDEHEHDEHDVLERRRSAARRWHRRRVRDVVELTVPIAFILGGLIGAGMVGGVVGWYLRDRR